MAEGQPFVCPLPASKTPLFPEAPRTDSHLGSSLPSCELEPELETVAGKIVCSQPEAVRSCTPDTRRFVEVGQRDLCKLLNSELRIARAAIGNHVQKITLTPVGRAFIASGSWDLLGEGGAAVTMVPGARH